MTSYERQIERINRNRTIADEWVSELERHLRKWGRAWLMNEHTGYAFAAFAQGIDPECCANRMMDIDDIAYRTVVEAF